MGNKNPSGGKLTADLPDRPVLLAFIVAVFLIGGNALAVSFTVAELAPFWGAAIRFATATIILAIVILVRRVPLPRGRTLGGVVLYGLLNFGLSFAFIYFAIREVTAGFTTIILALTPLLALLFAVLHRLEPFRWRALLGALLALTGIAIAFAGQAQGGVPLWAVLFMVVAAACFAEATVVIKILPPISPLVANGVGMFAATIFLTSLSLLTGEARSLPEQTRTWAAVIYLIVFGSVGLFYLMVLAPIVTVPLGALLAGEQITVELLIGAVLVLAAVFFGALSTALDERTVVESPTSD